MSPAAISPKPPWNGLFATPPSSNTSENVQYDIESTSPSQARMVLASHGPM